MIYAQLILFLCFLAFIGLVIFFLHGSTAFIIMHYLCIIFELGISVFYFLHTNSAYFVHDFFIQTAFSISAFYLFLHIFYRKPFIGLFMLPAIISTGILCLCIGYYDAPQKLVESTWLRIHISLNIIGMTLLLTSFSSGFMYFFLGNQLKTKKLGLIFKKFPPLSALEKMGWASLHTGFCFYTLGLCISLAFVFMGNAGKEFIAGNFNLKITMSLITWIIIAGIIFTQKMYPRVLKRVMFVSVCGSINLAVMYVTVSLFILR